MSADALPAPSRTFGKERRLVRRADFLRVQASTHRVATASYVLLVAPRPEAAREGLPSRLGLTVGKKVGHSPDRNRVKRVFRELFRLWPEPGLVPSGFDLVVIARAGAPKLGLAEARAEVQKVARLLAKRCEESLSALAHAPRAPHVPARA